MAPDTPAKRRGKLQFLIRYLFKYLYYCLIKLCEETIVGGKLKNAKKCKLYRSIESEEKKKNDALRKKVWHAKLKENPMKYEQYKANERYRKLQNKENKAVEAEGGGQCSSSQEAHSAINKRSIAAYPMLKITYQKVRTKKQKSSKS